MHDKAENHPHRHTGEPHHAEKTAETAKPAASNGSSSSVWQNPIVIASIIIAIAIIVGAGMFLAFGGNQPNTPDTNQTSKIVEVIEFSDFQCPICVNAYPTVEQLKKDYADKINFSYKHFPIRSKHPLADKAAQASECARDQGKFESYYQKLFTAYDAWAVDSAGYPLDDVAVGVSQFKQYAKDLGLNSVPFDACLDSGEKEEVIVQHEAQGTSLGINGTPSYVINGKVLAGNQPLATLKAEIDRAATGQSTPVTPTTPIETVPIEFTIITDDNCSFCNTTAAQTLQGFNTLTPQIGFTITTKTVSASSAQGQTLLSQMDYEYLPQVVVEDKITTLDSYTSVAQLFPKNDDGLVTIDLYLISNILQQNQMGGNFAGRWLTPPAVGNSASLGPVDAPVTIIEFSDLQCPFCKVFFEDTEKQLLAAYEGKVRFVYKHYPLDTTCNTAMGQQLHPYACQAAVASECAKDQNQFWAYHDQLFTGWTDNSGNSPNWARSDADANRLFNQYAKDLNLNTTQFGTCLANQQTLGIVQGDIQLATQYNMGGTPGFYINGINLGGAYPLDTFKLIIDAELARLGK